PRCRFAEFCEFVDRAPEPVGPGRRDTTVPDSHGDLSGQPTGLSIRCVIGEVERVVSRVRIEASTDDDRVRGRDRGECVEQTARASTAAKQSEVVAEREDAVERCRVRLKEVVNAAEEPLLHSPSPAHLDRTWRYVEGDDIATGRLQGESGAPGTSAKI